MWQGRAMNFTPSERVYFSGTDPTSGISGSYLRLIFRSPFLALFCHDQMTRNMTPGFVRFCYARKSTDFILSEAVSRQKSAGYRWDIKQIPGEGDWIVILHALERSKWARTSRFWGKQFEIRWNSSKLTNIKHKINVLSLIRSHEQREMIQYDLVDS